MSDIIKTLVNLAAARRLTGQEVQRVERIDFVIDLDNDGEIVHVSPTAASYQAAKGGYRAQEEIRRGKRMAALVPYSLGSTNNQLPHLLWGRAHDWFPASVPPDEAKHPAVWASVTQAATSDELKEHAGLQAVAKLASRRPTKQKVKEEVADSLEALNVKASEFFSARITFRFNGRLVLCDRVIIDWWASLQEKKREKIASQLVKGRDFWRRMDDGPMAEDFPCVLGNIPLQSFYNAPFRSFGVGAEWTWKERGLKPMPYRNSGIDRTNGIVDGSFAVGVFPQPRPTAHRLAQRPL
ncbi:MAG: type I-C CRISPR-associated protein Cas8c/Csd1, partial [Verrucomicrobiota bacterium]